MRSTLFTEIRNALAGAATLLGPNHAGTSNVHFFMRKCKTHDIIFNYQHFFSEKSLDKCFRWVYNLFESEIENESHFQKGGNDESR